MINLDKGFENLWIKVVQTKVFKKWLLDQYWEATELYQLFLEFTCV